MDQFEAARLGDLQWFKHQEPVLKVFENLVSELNIPSEVDENTLDGCLDVVKCLFHEIAPEEMICDIVRPDDQEWYAHDYAAAYGHTELLTYLYDECPQRIKFSQHNSVNLAIQQAVINGHLSAVKYMLEKCSCHQLHINTLLQNPVSLRVAAQNGHTSVIDYIFDECPQSYCFAQLKL